MSKKPSETLDDKIALIAIRELTYFQAITHLRVKAMLDKETGKVHEPSEVWRSMANNPLFDFSRADSLFRIHHE